MPTVHVNVWKGFKEEDVKFVIENITQVFVDLDIPAHAVEVLVHEVPQSHWGIGGVPASEKFKDLKVPGWISEALLKASTSWDVSPGDNRYIIPPCNFLFLLSR